MDKAIAYYRVSSKGQEDNFSLPAQERLSLEYAAKNSLEIIKSWSGPESAWKVDRENFSKLIEFAKRNKDIKHIIFYDLSRATRNDIDKTKLFTLIKEFDKTIHFAGTNKKLDKSVIDGEFITDIEVALHKKYSSDISRRASMGMDEKCKQGQYPSGPPIGYKTNPKTRMLELDPETAPNVAKIFNLIGNKNYSLSLVVDYLEKSGIKSKRGNKISDTSVSLIIRNIFYIGKFKWKGVLYQGNHEKLVSTTLWERANGVLNGKAPYLGKITRVDSFPYNNLIRCGTCGCKVGGETKNKTLAISKQKVKYVYYHCYFSKGRHAGRPYIPEPVLESMFERAVKQIFLSESRLKLIKQGITKASVNNAADFNKNLATLKAEQTRLEHRIDIIYEEKLDGKIDQTFWDTKHKEYNNKLEEVRRELSKMTESADHTEEGIKSLELINNLIPLWKVSAPEEKAEILHLIASNYLLKDKTLEIIWKKPFSFLQNMKKNSLVEQSGIEPPASALRTPRSPS
jgi:site-specific DNA recombinase